jgi:uncharacterized membrane protein YjdF
MILLTIFGFGMFVLGSVMAFKPVAFSNGIASFSQKSWFHAFEITSRIIFGILLILFAEQSSFANLLYFLGGILCFVGVFLLLIGSKRHKRFALLTSRIGEKFRPIGVVGQICGVVLMYIGLA